MKNVKQMSDNELVVLALQNNQAAYTELFKRYKYFVKSILFQKSVKEFEKEDLCINTLTKVLLNLHKYDSEKGSLKTWIYRVADNTIKDYYKKAIHKYQTQYITNCSETGEYNIDFVSSDSADGKILYKEKKQFIDRKIIELPKKYKKIIEMIVDEKTNDEMAKELNVNKSLVAVQKSRALLLLKQNLQCKNRLAC